LETQKVESAGGVVFRAVNGNLEVALIKKRSLWFLPKGLIEPSETFEDAALREVKEETGLDSDVVKKIGEIRYDFTKEKHRYFKTVHYYLLKNTGGCLQNHDSEVDRAKWVPLSEALKMLNYALERKILRKAERMVKREYQPHIN